MICIWLLKMAHRNNSSTYENVDVPCFCLYVYQRVPPTSVAKKMVFTVAPDVRILDFEQATRPELPPARGFSIPQHRRHQWNRGRHPLQKMSAMDVVIFICESVLSVNHLKNIHVNQSYSLLTSLLPSNV